MTQPLWDPSAPTPAFLKVTDLETHLRTKGLGLGVAVYEGIQGQPLPTDPGPMLVVTMLPGFGHTTEGVMDNPQFQVRTIGPQGDNTGIAHELAVRVDRVLVPEVKTPLSLGGLHVADIWRVGAPQMLFKEQSGRCHYVCTYNIQIEAYGG